MRFAPPPKDSFHEETLFSCFVGKRVRDASIYVSKKYRSSFYSRAIATIATNVTMLQCYMLHVTLRFARPRHCIIPRKTDPPLRLNGNASFFVRFLV